MSFTTEEQEIQQPLSYEIFKFTYNNKVYRFTSYEQDITYDGWTYVHIPIRRSDIAIGTGSMEFGSCTIKFPASNLDVNDSSFDPPYDFTIEIKQIHVDSGNEVIIAIGTVISIDQNGQDLSLSVKNESFNMFENVPKVRIQRLCNNRLFDTTCGLLRSQYEMFVEVVDFDMNIPVPSTGQRYWRNKMNSYVFNANQDLPFYSITYRDVKADTFGNLVSDYVNFVGEIEVDRTGKKYYLTAHLHLENKILSSPFIPDLQIGDILKVVVGCPKDPTTCLNRFGNLSQFVGFPYIPLDDVMSGFQYVTTYVPIP